MIQRIEFMFGFAVFSLLLTAVSYVDNYYLANVLRVLLISFGGMTLLSERSIKSFLTIVACASTGAMLAVMITQFVVSSS